jgi:hypothetical protein
MGGIYEASRSRSKKMRLIKKIFERNAQASGTRMRLNLKTRLLSAIHYRQSYQACNLHYCALLIISAFTEPLIKGIRLSPTLKFGITRTQVI